MKSFYWAVALAASIPFAAAQTGSITSGAPSSGRTTAASSTATQTGTATYTVQVGVQHAFIPPTVVAKPGDIIRFEFSPTNHSVVKADFGDPCVPYEYHHRGADTFFSGPKLSEVGDAKPVWTLRVNSTDPVMFYCSAPDSCLKWKMIGVINPNSTWSLENQLAYHDNFTKFQLSPGEPYPDEGGPSTSSAVLPGPSSTSSPAPSNPGAPQNLSGGAIAGIAIGAAAVMFLGGAFIWFCGRRGGIETGYRKSTIKQPSTTQVVDAQYGNGPDPKSPGFGSSPYTSGVPTSAAGHSEAFRATSPSWSHSQGNIASPHHSYMGPSGSPGIAPYGAHSPLMNGQEHQHTGSSGYYDAYGNEIPKIPEQAPVELPVQDNVHPSELDSNQYAHQNMSAAAHEQAQYNAQQQQQHHQQPPQGYFTEQLPHPTQSPPGPQQHQ